ncbi:Protein CREG2 [Linum perenne]
MNIRGVASSVYVFYVVFLLANSVQGRRSLAVKKPDPNNAAATSRWLVSQNSWGVLNTLSTELGGAPFGNVVSFSDGEPGKGAGVPYFYLTTLDPTARNAMKDARSSFTISEYPLGTCGKADPENPTCAKITLTGKLISVEEKSKEAEFARNALFTKHPEMKGWPKGHDFQVYKLVIEDIFLIDWFGGPKPLTVEEYLKAKIYSIRNKSNCDLLSCFHWVIFLKYTGHLQFTGTNLLTFSERVNSPVCMLVHLLLSCDVNVKCA